MPVSEYWVRGTLPNTFLLCAVREHLAAAYGLVLAVVHFQSVEVVVAAKRLAVHHTPEVKVDAFVSVGGVSRLS